MNRLRGVLLGALGATTFLCFGVCRTQAQAQSQPPANSQAAQKADENEEEGNPFEPKPAPPLPPQP